MKKRGSLSLFVKFGFFSAAMVLLIMGTGQWFSMRQARQALIGRLYEKAKFIDNFYAYVVADALNRQDDVTLLQAVGILELDQEITSVVVVDKKSQIRYAADPEKVGTVLKDTLVQKALASGDGISTTGANGGGQTLVSVAPLKVQGIAGSIGAMRIEYTFNFLDKQLSKVIPSFKMTMLGSILMWCGFMFSFVRKTVVEPLEITKARLMALNPGLLEANLPEDGTEFGALNGVLNELIIKLKTEMSTRNKELRSTGDQEQYLFELLNAFLVPGWRVILVDKDNQVLSDTGDEAGQEPAGRHLLDLITDANFANLVADSFQKEGEVVRAEVLWQERPYQAAVIHLPESATQLVRTLIALQAVKTEPPSATV